MAVKFEAHIKLLSNSQRVCFRHAVLRAIERSEKINMKLYVVERGMFSLKLCDYIPDDCVDCRAENTPYKENRPKRLEGQSW